jgi:hypothetical protein
MTASTSICGLKLSSSNITGLSCALADETQRKMVLTAPAPSTVDPQVFKLVSSASLQSLLDKIIGPKTLVLDSTLAGPLGLITEVGLLKVTLPAFLLPP